MLMPWIICHSDQSVVPHLKMIVSKENKNSKKILFSDVKSIVSMKVRFRDYVNCQKKYTNEWDRSSFEACVASHFIPGTTPSVSRYFSDWLLTSLTISEPFKCNDKSLDKVSFVLNSDEIPLCLYIYYKSGTKIGYVIYKKINQVYLLERLKIPHQDLSINFKE